MRKVIIACVVGVVLIGVLLAVGVWWLLIRELPTLEASISLPPEAALDSSFPMTMTATNTHKVTVTLDSIDIDDSFLSGFQVMEVVPKPVDTMHLPFVNQRSWAFGKEVHPGSAMTVTFRLRAVQEGHFSGDVDVCNPNQDYVTLVADVVVRRTKSGEEHPGRQIEGTR